MTLTTCAGANAAAVAKAEAMITDFMAAGWFWVGFGRAGVAGCLQMRHVLDLLQASSACIYFLLLQSAIMSSPKGARGKLMNMM